MMRSGVVLICLASACVKSEAIPCGDLTCPPGTTCDLPNRRCIDPAQTTQCMGADDGKECEVRGVPGECRAAVCEPTICGDGRKAMSEACDRSEMAGATCLDAGFYEPAGLQCTPFCTFDTSLCNRNCGDDVIDEDHNELCDGAPPIETCTDVSFDIGTLTCTNACLYGLAGCGRVGWRQQTTLPGNTPSVTPYLVHGSRADDVWVAGNEGRARHFDGSVWVDQPFGSTSEHARSLWTVSPTAAWVATSAGTLKRWDGTAWSADASAPSGVNGVWASAPDDVWIVTESSGVKRWTGAAWSDVGGVTQGSLALIHGDTVDDVWVATASGTVLRWNGTSWSAPTSIRASSSFNAIYAVAPDDVYAVGHATNGNTNALISHWNGLAWTHRLATAFSEYYSISATAANDVWIAGNASTEHFDGQSWSSIQPPTGGSGLRIVALDAGHVIGATKDGIHLVRGLAIGVAGAPITNAPAAFFTTPDGHIFVAESTSTAIARRDGDATWSTQTVAAGQVAALWGAAGDDVWAVGSSTNAYHFTGTSWSSVPITSPVPLTILWGSGSTDLWAAGANGAVRHFNGSSWTARDLPMPITGLPVGFTGTGPNDVWLSAAGSLFHWTGTWTEVDTPTSPGPVVSVAPGRAMFVSGSNAYRLDGSTWTPLALPPTIQPIIALHARDDDSVFGVVLDAVVEYDGNRFAPVTSPVPSFAAIAISGTANRVDILYLNRSIRSIVIVQPWRCTADESSHCGDSMDNDCDGSIDTRDSDCP